MYLITYPPISDSLIKFISEKAYGENKKKNNQRSLLGRSEYEGETKGGTRRKTIMVGLFQIRFLHIGPKKRLIR